MLATCMKYKMIKNFILNYNESRWSKLIPSLLQIAIINLHISFKTSFFSEKELENIIKDLKFKFKKKMRNNEINNKSDLDEMIITKSTDKNKRRRKAGKSKCREEEIKDDDDRYEDDFCEGEIEIKRKKRKKSKSNYAISYDKNLKPEIIEKKELKNKNGEKIVKRMTQEEFNAQYDSQGEEREREVHNYKKKIKIKKIKKLNL